MGLTFASSPAARELLRELRRFSAPWRRRALEERALLAAALVVGLLACGWWSPELAAMLGFAALALGVRATRGAAARKLREVERQLACEGAIGAALECAHEVPLGALAARDQVRRLRAAAAPAALQLRPACWLALGAALFAAAATLGVAAERARSTSAPAPLAALEGASSSSAAVAAGEQAEDDAALTREVEELRAQRAAGALSSAEFAERLERASRSYARPRADSSMSRPTAAADDSARGSDASSGASAPGATAESPAGASRAGTAPVGNAAWAELPERYRRCVARYFGRRD
ncbi:MAG: hypothetical protein JNM84_20470 [Planctomycetes bacterium]|nr:hypothetical protein [Planctomycetota bacterium]